MSDTSGTAAEGLELRLELPGGAALPLDRVLIAVVEVRATATARVSARVNLIEGDLSIAVTAPGGATLRCAWPWPADAAGRTATIPPGGRITGTVPLIASDTSAPLFPVPGRYTLTASFDAAPGVTLVSAPVTVERTAAADPSADRALRSRDVLQSLLSMGVIGEAQTELELLAAGGDPATASLADLALGRLDEAVRPDAGGDEVARAVASVRPSLE